MPSASVGAIVVKVEQLPGRVGICPECGEAKPVALVSVDGEGFTIARTHDGPCGLPCRGGALPAHLREDKEDARTHRSKECVRCEKIAKLLQLPGQVAQQITRDLAESAYRANPDAFPDYVPPKSKKTVKKSPEPEDDEEDAG